MTQKFLAKNESSDGWTPAHTRRFWRYTLIVVIVSLSVSIILTTVMFQLFIWQAALIAFFASAPAAFIIFRRQINYQIIIEKQNADLQHLNTELNAFAHTVAHDLKNPMHIITGYMQLLEEGELSEPEELSVAYQMISDSANLAHQIVEDLLLLAHSGTQVDYKPLAMEHVVEQAWERQRWLIDKHEATLQQPAAWPPLNCYAPWIEAIWSNLLSNAIKYGGKPPEIAVGCNTQAGGTLRFWVRDNGEGIPATSQSQLFTEFSRLGQESSEGHGLGLWIVKRIVERLGGDVGVESVEGAGSTFWFTLPAAVEQSGS